MRNKLLILALLMFIFAFQFSTSGELAILMGMQEIDWKLSWIEPGIVGGDTYYLTWVLSWEKNLNALLWCWFTSAPAILLALYCGFKQPKMTCKVKSPALFIMGLLFLAPFIFKTIFAQVQFITEGRIVVGTVEVANAKWSDLSYAIKHGDVIGQLFSLFLVFCWFIGTTLICKSIE